MLMIFENSFFFRYSCAPSSSFAGSPQTAAVLDSIEIHGKKCETIILNQVDMYINEMNYFLDVTLGKKTNSNSIYHAYQVLKIVLGEEGK